MSIANIQQYLQEKAKLPISDLHDRPTSTQTFAGGSHYRIEIAGIESVTNYETLVKEAKRRGIPVHRVIGTVGGSARLTMSELKEYAAIAAENRIETLVNPIPSRSWDNGRQYLTSEGYVSGMRIRGQDMALCPAQQGVLYFRVHVTGKAGHGGERYLGVSAIEKAAFVLEALGELERRRGEEWNHPLYREVPIPFTINVGTIQGGAWPSMVPEHVAFEGRMGVAPGETLQQARCSMEDFLAGLEERDPWFREHPPQVEWLPNRLYSAQIPEDHPLVDTAKAAFAQVMQWQPQMAGTAFGTDASVLTNFAGTPTLVFGPGSVAHCADESIAVDTLLDYTRVMAQLIADWCGSD